MMEDIQKARKTDILPYVLSCLGMHPESTKADAVHCAARDGGNVGHALINLIFRLADKDIILDRAIQEQGAVNGPLTVEEMGDQKTYALWQGNTYMGIATKEGAFLQKLAAAYNAQLQASPDVVLATPQLNESQPAYNAMQLATPLVCGSCQRILPDTENV